MGGKRRIALDEHFFDEIDTPEKAYWLGFLATDGNVYGNEVRIRLAEADSAHLDQFAAALGSQHRVVHAVNNFGRSCATFRVKCKHMVERLALHGVGPQKSFTVRPWEGPAHLLPHYWRGAVDGDGWICGASSKNGAYAVGFCGNEHMVQGFIAFVVSHLGEQMRAPLVKVKNRNIYQTMFGGSYRAADVCRLLRYDDHSLPALPRKREGALGLLALAPETKRPRWNLTLEDARRIEREWQAGAGVEELAARYGVGKGTGYNALRHLGRFAALGPLPAGGRRLLAQLSMERAREIYDLHHTGGLTVAQIAEQYALSQATIYEIVGGYGRYAVFTSPTTP